jgi:superfamily II DNA or RNA helicase
MSTTVENNTIIDEYKTILNRQYIINKRFLDRNALRKIRRDLTVQPITFNVYGGEPDSFPIYQEDSRFIAVPRYYGLKYHGKPEYNMNKKRKEAKFSFSSSLRAYQRPVIKIILKGIKKKGGGILSVKCGWGKTIGAIYCAHKLEKKTLVIVHKTFLLNQWVERIKEFTNARIGTIQGKTIDIKDKDIVIGMLQSISMKDYPQEIFNEFGLVIIDETHRIGSLIYSRALPKISTTYMLGLSATPEREDGLSKVFKWSIGDILFQDVDYENKEVIVKTYFYNSGEFNRKYNKMGGMDNAGMITQFTESSERNKFMVNLIPALIQDNRKVLILSERVDHVKDLQFRIDSLNICTTGLLIGLKGKKMPPNYLDEVNAKDVILGTYRMISEGYDNNRLNTLILATPMKKVQQSIGRILRKAGDSPLIIDVVDTIMKHQYYGKPKKKKKKIETKKCSICDLCIEREVKTACGHSYHAFCIYQYLETDPNCPICKRVIDEDKIEDCFVDSYDEYLFEGMARKEFYDECKYRIIEDVVFKDKPKDIKDVSEVNYSECMF